MPITAEHVGRRYPPTTPYRVSKAKIAEFAAALGDSNPAYTSESPVAPPTFAAVIAARSWDALFGDEELDLALHRVVHAEQSFEFLRPLREGDDVVAVLGIERVRNRGRLDIVSVLCELSVAGQTSVLARSTFMHTREQADA